MSALSRVDNVGGKPLDFIPVDYGGHTSRPCLKFPNDFKVQEFLLTDPLKRMKTDGCCDITFLVDGRVLGPFSQKCQDSAF